jgi:hypothetical protein
VEGGRAVVRSPSRAFYWVYQPARHGKALDLRERGFADGSKETHGRGDSRFDRVEGM